MQSPPFADYLRKLANDLEISGKVDFFPETTSDVAVGRVRYALGH